MNAARKNDPARERSAYIDMIQAARDHAAIDAALDAWHAAEEAGLIDETEAAVIEACWQVRAKEVDARHPEEAERRKVAMIAEDERRSAERREANTAAPHNPRPVRFRGSCLRADGTIEAPPHVRPGRAWQAPIGQLDPAKMGEVR